MRLLFLIVCLLCPFILFAQPINIGVANDGPPFEIPEDNKSHLSGFEVDLMQEICRRAQFKCLFKTFTFPDLFNAILDNRIDLAIATISITPERQENFLFSLPYLPGSAQYVTNISNPIKTIDDIKGKNVGIEKGSIFKAWVMSQLGHTTQVQEYKNLAEVLQALNDGKVDAILLDSGKVQYWVANNSDLFRPVGNPMSTGYGIMANKTQVELINTINKYLIQLENDGTYLKLYQRYFD
ncbi:transporter substrate-binding domain-containing protein [Legionella brunensis]|uniref:Arginine 3rd transport system periplasmic binding protein n=1 Tax=Legionella brunensis TaxID=29422 RepID=A0A0W0SPN4_9GAMM|nr:transporter substrate-binding domain-containing protein [Legionella brunensis]KTC85177.1 arginine 3rd transport system periplasmic binding protein [Legionella brunensis]